jgi:hypothetical protein
MFLNISIFYLFSIYIYLNNILICLYILGIITTIAGNGSIGDSGDVGLATSATINGPTSVTIDPITGDVYIADAFNHRIRLITNSSGNNYIYIYITIKYKYIYNYYYVYIYQSKYIY